MANVLVDAENVRRSLWPNMPGDELEARTKAWAREHGHTVTVVWEGNESGDDQIVRLVRELESPVWGSGFSTDFSPLGNAPTAKTNRTGWRRG